MVESVDNLPRTLGDLYLVEESKQEPIHDGILDYSYLGREAYWHDLVFL